MLFSSYSDRRIPARHAETRFPNELFCVIIESVTSHNNALNPCEQLTPQRSTNLRENTNIHFPTNNKSSCYITPAIQIQD